MYQKVPKSTKMYHNVPKVTIYLRFRNLNSKLPINRKLPKWYVGYQNLKGTKLKPNLPNLSKSVHVSLKTDGSL